MKRYYLLVMIIAFISSCNNNSRKEIVDERSNNFEKRERDSIKEINIQKYYWKPVNEKITLLSFKYELSDSIIKKIILEYVKEYEPLSYSILIYGLDSIGHNYNTPDPNLENLIYKISTENSLNARIVASIIFDYKLLSSIEALESSADVIK